MKKIIQYTISMVKVLYVVIMRLMIIKFNYNMNLFGIKKFYKDIIDRNDIATGTKIAHFSILIIEIDDNNQIEKIKYAIDSLFWMSRLDNSQREREIIEVYESKIYKRRYDFENYINSLRIYTQTKEFSELTYKPKETIMDVWEKRKENK